MKDVNVAPDQFQELWDGHRVVAFLPSTGDIIKENTVLIVHEQNARTMKLTGRELHATAQYPTLIQLITGESCYVLQLKVYKRTSPEIVRMRAKEA